MSSNHFLGEGTYGMVREVNGKAVKTFKKDTHLIQEYAAGAYLLNCPYVVNVTGINFAKLETTMELYDGSLKEWLLQSQRTVAQKKSMVRHICLGLAWLGDLGIVHGDLKPGNVVANWDKRTGNLTKVAIADLGFVAPEMYSKTKLTAPIYREMVVESDFRHDIYSLGVILIQCFGGVKIRHQKTSRELIDMARTSIKDEKIRNIAIEMVSENRLNRPSSREILKRLFNEIPDEQKLDPIPKYIHPVSDEDNSKLKDFFKRFNPGSSKTVIKINRVKLGYNACRHFLGKHGVKSDKHIQHACAMLVILTSIFGPSRVFDVKTASSMAGCSTATIYQNITNMINDRETRAYLFYTHRGLSINYEDTSASEASSSSNR